MARYAYANYTIYELYVNKKKRYKNTLFVKEKMHIKTLFKNWKFRVYKNTGSNFCLRWIIRAPFFYSEMNNCQFIIGLPFAYLIFNL